MRGVAVGGCVLLVGCVGGVRCLVSIVCCLLLLVVCWVMCVVCCCLLCGDC